MKPEIADIPPEANALVKRLAELGERL